MKKIIIALIITLTSVGIIIGGWLIIKSDGFSSESTKVAKSGKNTNGVEINSTSESDNIRIENTTTDSTINNNIVNKDAENKATEDNSTKNNILADEETYKTVIDNYRNAMQEYKNRGITSDREIETEYELVSTTLIEHVARYEHNGVKIAYGFYDIDKNGVDELIVGAEGNIGAIYTYDKTNNKVEKIHYLDTMERGRTAVYDNGVIFSQGAGGAMLHYYEFGKISNGTTYEIIEDIEEEYKGENPVPDYKDTKTGAVLNYISLQEIQNKYIENLNPVVISYKEL